MISTLPTLFSLPLKSFEDRIDHKTARQAVESLEQGNVVYLPNLAFSLTEAEKHFLTPEIVKKGVKNVSFNPQTQILQGHRLSSHQAERTLVGLMQRYANLTSQFLQVLAPGYCGGLSVGRTSFRPVEAKNRSGFSTRKDDRLLHIDAFPSMPVGSKRILRVFSNVNPNQGDRVWRLGPDFSTVLGYFFKKIRRPYPLESQFLKWIQATRTKRTRFDHAMYILHNTMKQDPLWQANTPQGLYTFPPNSSWIVYTDIVTHAVLSGQYVFEQTFYPELTSLYLKKHSPQAILAKKYGLALETIVS